MYLMQGQEGGKHRGEYMAQNVRTGELLLIQLDGDTAEVCGQLMVRWPRPFVSL